MDYNNPTPVVVCLVKLESLHPLDDAFNRCRMLAIRRAIPPMLGELAFPGGYVNELEDCQTAAKREFFEETGIETGLNFWTPRTTFCTPRNQLLVFMQYGQVMSEAYVNERFAPNEEASAWEPISNDGELCFPSHTAVLRTCR